MVRWAVPPNERLDAVGAPGELAVRHGPVPVPVALGGDGDDCGGVGVLWGWVCVGMGGLVCDLEAVMI